MLYNKKRGESIFFSIIQTRSTKTTNHIHKPLIGTVYLSENIIEPKNKKSCLFKVSLDNKQVRLPKVSSVGLEQVHWFDEKRCANRTVVSQQFLSVPLQFV